MSAGRGGSAARGRGRIASGTRPVGEGTRISISDQLAAFQQRPETEFTFENGLNNHDRAVVHAECKKLGFTSKSHGKGDNRAVTVYKPRGVNHTAASLVFDLPFKPESLQALQAHLQRHPPSEEEVQAAVEGGADAPLPAAVDTTPQQKRRRGGGQGAGGLSAAQLAAKQEAHHARLQQTDMQALNTSRGRLPIASFRDHIVQAVAGSQVVLISGETGCGKTTQVPQYLLEDCWKEGKPCRVMCTQPRRISAVSVAERVASERGEPIGDSVGYIIRLESKGGAHSSLMFCTNGVLLRMLTQGDGLDKVTHIVVDEIHERDRFADFLLILLRDILPARPSLRLILMSATLHVEMFSGYFGGCPVVTVPGFTYPVQDLYLEDILKSIGYTPPDSSSAAPPAAAKQTPAAAAAAEAAAVPPEQRAAVEAAIMAAFLNGDDASFDQLMEATGADMMAQDPASAATNIAHACTGATALMAAAGKGRLHEAVVLLANGAEPTLTSRDGSTAQDWAQRFGHQDVADLLAAHTSTTAGAGDVADSALALSHYQANTDADEVDLNLLATLLEYVSGEGAYQREDQSGEQQGAVLVFLPGWDEIIRLKDSLERKPAFSSSRYRILPLHSMVPAADQRRVFVRPPVGVRKIILATNIAETAITIDDVTVVINSGRLKEKSFDPYTSVSTLQSAWISRASEKQRRGRAGRCQEGLAFHCYSRVRSQALAELQLPELMRSPLDELCLQVKLLEGQAQGCHVADFLAKAVEPPAQAAITGAVQLLEDIGALEPGTEALTVLGRHLAALPLPPRVGKMLLYGLLFGCLDPVLTVACCMAYRDPWVLPVEAAARRAATASKARLAEGAGGASDHLALVTAFNGWVAARQAGGGRDRAFCAEHFLSSATMQMVDGMRHQLLGELKARKMLVSLQEASSHALDAARVRSVLACGFYPLFGRLLPPGSGPSQRNRSTLLTGKGEKVRVHPSSVNSQLQVPQPAEQGASHTCPVMIFDEITRGEAMLYVRQCTAVGAHALLLVCTHLRIAPEEEPRSSTGPQHMHFGEDGEPLEPVPQAAVFVVDDWLQLRAPLQVVAALACLRQRLAQAFAAKVQSSQPLPPSLADALRTVGQLFHAEADTPASLAAPQDALAFGRGRGFPAGDRGFPAGDRGFPAGDRGRARGFPADPRGRGPPGFKGRGPGSRHGPAPQPGWQHPPPAQPQPHFQPTWQQQELLQQHRPPRGGARAGRAGQQRGQPPWEARPDSDAPPGFAPRGRGGGRGCGRDRGRN